jgi:hypothetical protein
MGAIVACTAADGERADNSVPRLEVMHIRTYFLHNTSEFVAHDKISRRRLMASEDVKLAGNDISGGHSRNTSNILLDL